MNFDGARVCAQFPASAGEPPLQLKGFRKLSLEPGAAPSSVSFVLTDRCVGRGGGGRHALV